MQMIFRNLYDVLLHTTSRYKQHTRFNLFLHKNKKLYASGRIGGDQYQHFKDFSSDLVVSDGGYSYDYDSYYLETTHSMVQLEKNISLFGGGKDTYFVKRTNQDSTYKPILSETDIEVYAG